MPTTTTRSTRSTMGSTPRRRRRAALAPALNLSRRFTSTLIASMPTTTTWSTRSTATATRSATSISGQIKVQ
uniref:Uncharacterized protein n=1 Tax=Steinernema glaseri TaxID=37863 RepID=A0A1I7Y6M3_9BILA